jgi:hypothetical protein
MRRPAALFPIVLALGAMMLAPWAGVQAQDAREGPIEIEKCQTISQPGSYKLANNLTSTSACLVITADFVTIDLAGFTMSGPGVRLGAVGILAAPSSGELRGIAVRNGSISEFNIAVDLSSAGSIVEGLRVSAHGSPGGIGATGIVRGNIVTGIRGTGIVATGIVTGNIASGNEFGMSIGKGSTVTGNTITNNAHTGLDVGCPSNVTDNTAVDNGSAPSPGIFNLVLNGNGCNNTNNVAP